jgi:hypothetical protein
VGDGAVSGCGRNVRMVTRSRSMDVSLQSIPSTRLRCHRQPGTLAVTEGMVETDQVLAGADAAAQNAAVRQAMAGLDAAPLPSNRQPRLTSAPPPWHKISPEACRKPMPMPVQLRRKRRGRPPLFDQAQVVCSEITHHVRRALYCCGARRRTGQLVGPTISLLTLADLSGLRSRQMWTK